MAGNYIPASDGDFYAWEQNFTHYVEANTVALGLLPADVAPLAG